MKYIFERNHVGTMILTFSMILLSVILTPEKAFAQDDSSDVPPREEVTEICDQLQNTSATIAEKIGQNIDDNDFRSGIRWIILETRVRDLMNDIRCDVVFSNHIAEFVEDINDNIVGVQPVPREPDLVITEFETRGSPQPQEDGTIVLPVRVVVRNRGNAAAGIFKVSVDYSGSRGTFVLPFSSQGSIWYPFTNASLPAGGEVTFLGELTFVFANNETVAITALADSCSSDEFMPDYCRVRESNETNNESISVTVSLP